MLSPTITVLSKKLGSTGPLTFAGFCGFGFSVGEVSAVDSVVFCIELQFTQIRLFTQFTIENKVATIKATITSTTAVLKSSLFLFAFLRFCLFLYIS